MIKYLSLFSGIGGFELGIGDRAECVGFSEIDKYAVQIYQHHFPKHKNYGDITKIDAKELPDFDLLVGGFPCQPFSIAGRRGGFLDTRGTLFFEIARIIREKQPRLLLLENVKGLLSHGNGNTFYTIICALDELGYDLQWQVLNSKNHGVPQNRERVFIIGHLRGTARPEVFPIGGGDQEYPDEANEQGCASTLTGRSASGTNRRGNYVVGTLRTHKDGEGFRELKSGLAPTIPARAREDGSGQPVVAIPVLTPDRPTKRQNGRRLKDDGDPSFTLTAQDRHGIFDGVKIRRLTPKECERLQGFPDDWTDVVSDTQRYKTLGNAVTVNVIRDIVTRLLDNA